MKKKKGLFLFGYVKPNRYSWAILMGFIEKQKEIVENFDILPLPFPLYEIYKGEQLPEKKRKKIENINWEEYDLVFFAFSIMSIQYPLLKKEFPVFKEYIRKLHSNAFTLAGGPHASAKPEELAQLGFDFIIPNEGEIALKELLEESLKKIRNNAVNELRDPSRFDTTQLHGVARGVPYYKEATKTLLVNLDDYAPYSEKFRLFGPIEISRGCPFRCKFCQTGNASLRMRHASVDTIIKWVKRAVKIKYNKVWFLSPNAFGYGAKNGIKPNPTELERLLKALKSIEGLKGIYFGTFPSEVRPEFITRETLDAVTPYISNKYLAIGAQNASNRMLRQINRGHTFEDVLKAIDLLKEYKMDAYLDFIFGLPGETEEDIQENIKFFNKILDGIITNVRIRTHTFMPLPGTPYEKMPKGHIDSRILAIMGKLASMGKASGEYLTQAGLVKNKFMV